MEFNNELRDMSYIRRVKVQYRKESRWKIPQDVSFEGGGRLRAVIEKDCKGAWFTVQESNHFCFDRG